MSNKITQDNRRDTTHDDLPYIDPTAYYDTKGTSVILGKSEQVIRSWRSRGVGPKYLQSEKNAPCKYLGSWLITFRKSIIVEPNLANLPNARRART